jgi:hypothetical protein
VHIHNQYIEIIVCQITSKVSGLEDRMCNSFLLGELIELLRVEVTWHVLEEVICYQAILFGNNMTDCLYFYLHWLVLCGIKMQGSYLVECYFYASSQGLGDGDGDGTFFLRSALFYFDSTWRG